MNDSEKLHRLKLAVERLLRNPAIDILYARDFQLWLLLLLMPKIAKALAVMAKSILEIEETLEKIRECG